MFSQFAFNDFFKNEYFKNPYDFNQIFSTQRRNIEALSAANQVVVESAQAISRRQAELARENVEESLKASKDLMSSGSPEAGLAKNVDLAKSFFESALSNLREITETVTKSGFEAFDILNRRAAESLDELSSAGSKAASKKKSA